MSFAYADPPYPGLSKRYYGEHADYDGEVDHSRLLVRLVDQYPDGWALSTSAAALPMVLALCAAELLDVRVAAWIRRLRPHPTARAPVSSWEPVVFAGGRQDGTLPCRFDALTCRSGPRTTDPGRVVGSKPAEFAWWMFDLLGARPGDHLDDLYPGSGGIARAWSHLMSLDVGHDASPEYSRDVSPRSTHDA